MITAEMERMFAELRVGDTEQAVNARVAYRLAEEARPPRHPVAAR